MILYLNVGDTRPDLSKVGNHLECNISLSSQVCCYGSFDWSKCGSCDFHLFLKGVAIHNWEVLLLLCAGVYSLTMIDDLNTKPVLGVPRLV